MNEVSAVGPREECDLVMKGGVTSGIVYPALALRLSHRFRFRNIAGTSAGAIAAAATAAAEHGRDQAGFERLAEVSRRLADPAFLLGLFQPEPGTRRLFYAALEIARISKHRMPTPRKLLATALALARAEPWGCARGALLGTLLGALSGLLAAASARLLSGVSGPEPLPALASAALVPALLGGLAGSAIGTGRALVLRLSRRLPAQSFGLCPGTSSTGAPAIGEWMAETFDSLAGVAGPLTFGDLAARGVRLRMVTTNLSQQRPYTLPFQKRRFVFRESELRGLFPGRVVDHLVAHGHASARVGLPEGFFFLPDAERLPVVVAARLSLSFPLLFAAVPLYTIARSALAGAAPGERRTLTPDALQRNWFSDGGICSNFPIHFFDDWLPSRPTFGVKLTAFPGAALRDEDGVARVDAGYLAARGTRARSVAAGRDAVFLPRANQALPVEWRPLGGVFDFLWSIFAAAQNHHDNTLSELPGHRSRIVQIRLKDEEGGLNLAMAPGTIGAMIEKGDAAGRLLAGFDFERHKWVRFRCLAGELERELRRLAERLDATGAGSYGIDDLMRRQTASRDDPFPYRRDERWCRRARARIASLARLVARWRRPLLEAAPPRPRGSLRLTERAAEDAAEAGARRGLTAPAGAA